MDQLNEIDQPRQGFSKPVRIILWGGLGAFALVVLAFMAIGFLMESGHLPDTAVREAQRVPDSMQSKLHKLGVLQGDEELYFFYSYGLFSPAAGGSVLSSFGLVNWYEAEDESFTLDRIPYAAVQGLRMASEGGVLEDALVEVETEHYLYSLEVSTENNGHNDFLERAQQEWKRRGGNRPGEIPEGFEAEAEADALNEDEDAPGEATGDSLDYDD